MLGLFYEILKHWILGTSVVVLDVPLLFEAKIDWLTRPIIVVWVDDLTQEARLMARDNSSKEQARNRITSQLPLDVKRARADIVIDNSGSLEQTKDNHCPSFLERASLFTVGCCCHGDRHHHTYCCKIAVKSKNNR
jgi:dephospho-CoA kinase